MKRPAVAHFRFVHEPAIAAVKSRFRFFDRVLAFPWRVYANALSLHALRDSLFEVQPDGTASFNNANTTNFSGHTQQPWTSNRPAARTVMPLTIQRMCSRLSWKQSALDLSDEGEGQIRCFTIHIWSDWTSEKPCQGAPEA